MENQTVTLRPPVWAMLLAVIIGGCFYVGGKSIEVRDHTPTTISVTGEGKVYSAPDIAELSFGMQTGPRSSAKEAMSVLKQNMNKVYAATKAAGVEEKDISTEQFSLDPQYDWNNGTQTLRGYAASQSFLVKVRDLDKVSDVLTAATNAGANQAGNVNFTIDKPQQLEAQAREQAIAEAKQKAQTLASDLGMALGKIKGFSEDGAQPPVPIRYDMKAQNSVSAGAAIPDLPLPSGQQQVTSDVTITYELN